MSKFKITALILCGGRGNRLGGQDKGLVDFRGQPLVASVIQRIQPQVDQLCLNANRNLARYREYGLRIITDEAFMGEGPLAGILAGLRHCDTDYLAILPCDSPFIPPDLIYRLNEPFRTKAIHAAIAHDGKVLQPAFSLINKDTLESLRLFLDSGERKLGRWLQSVPHALIDFSDQEQAFINLNTEEDFLQFGDPQ